MKLLTALWVLAVFVGMFYVFGEHAKPAPPKPIASEHIGTLRMQNVSDPKPWDKVVRNRGKVRGYLVTR
jgi:hypothetical protein